jgi:hypothetical protein
MSGSLQSLYARNFVKQILAVLSVSPHIYMTPWNRKIVEKLIVVGLANNFSALYATRLFTVHSTCLYPKPVEFSPHSHTRFKIPFKIILQSTLSFPNSLFTSFYRLQFLFFTSPMHALQTLIW